MVAVVNTQFVGFHCWPDAPERRAYLAHRHRHLFKVCVKMSVTHDEREVEYHDLKDAVDDIVRRLTAERPAEQVEGELGAMSCETIARKISGELHFAFGADRDLCISVMEDGEVGAEFYTP